MGQKTANKGILPAIGVCYYPEHWPQSIWQEDAQRMAELGIKFVRIGEFAWSKMEPSRDDFDFDWLDQAIEILHNVGLKVVLGTPTATPPKWLVDEMPDMLPVSADGKVRGFGSRRHYSFSHEGYKLECARITEILAKRYGNHDAIAAWQTDNEYDCHNTTLSYSPIDLAAFRNWLSQKYQSPQALNKAWGNVFWSMEYTSFDQVELPVGSVTEINPAHLMDYRRFASDKVVEFNKLQTDIIRRHSPGRDVIHNFMGRTLAFDHFKVGVDLDISSWDSYPLGFLEDRSDQSESFKKAYSRSGDPDFQAFHHDLYRATSNGRWWVMEQQPGPVNWAPHNPMPRKGMVSLWSLEAFAHGAEVVSYFRWRQAPFAQEQMHSGLLKVNSAIAPGFEEASATKEALEKLGELAQQKSDVVIVFDYASSWSWDVQPQGAEFDYFRIVFDFYRALRAQGLNVDFTNADDPDLEDRKLVFIPALFAWNDKLLSAVKKTDANVVVGPRSGSKTNEFKVPDSLPPNLSASLLDAKVERVESLRSDCPVSVGDAGAVKFWREEILIGKNAKVMMHFEGGMPALIRQGKLFYLAGWPDQKLLANLLTVIGEEAGLNLIAMPKGVRHRSADNKHFYFNYSNEAVDLSSYCINKKLLFGDKRLAPSGVLVIEQKLLF